MTDEYSTDKDGSVIDPPILPEFEDKLRAAQARGDENAVAAVQDDYDKARRDAAGVTASGSAKTTTKTRKGGGRP